MRFTKMHGCGNDYVVIDAADVAMPDFSALARTIADRRRGVGADGLIWIGPEQGATFRMRMFNPDGSEAEMCGNGLRCAVEFARQNRAAPAKGTVGTLSGVLAYEVLDASGDVRIELGRPGGAFDRPQQLVVGGHTLAVHIGTLGNPHAVCFVDDVDAFDLADIGPQVETHDAFPDRTNFEVVQVVAPDHVRQRTWERGVGETLACGTGAGAVCVASAASGRTQRTTRIDLRGGTLHAAWEADDRVFIRGPAVTVFEGNWPLEAGDA